MKRTIIAAAVIAAAALSIAALGQRAKDAETLYHKGVHFEEVRGELKEAIKIYEEIVAKYADDRPLAAKAYYHLGLCYERLGRAQAADAFQKVVQGYPEQTEMVSLARERLGVLLKASAPAGKADRELKVRRVWQGPGMDSTGEISPDGKYLSCVDWTTSDLAVRDMETGKVRRLTSKEGSPPGSYEASDGSIWSPDSREIAYNWYGYNPEFCELRVLALDGSKPRVLYRGDYYKDWVHPCDWSSDGRYILTKFLNTGSLGLISVADGSVRRLDGVEVMHLDLARLSPDGGYVAFEHPQKSDTAKRDLSIVSVDGKEDVALVEHPSDDRLLGWAPDGKSVVFLSDRTGTWDAWLVGVVGGKPRGDPRMVRRGIGIVKALGLTRSGSLYYSTPGFEWDVFSASLDPDTGRIVDAPKKLPLLSEGHNFSPKLSPDGKFLFYRSERGPGRLGQYVPRVFSFETGESREVRPEASFLGFSIGDRTADGRSILLHGDLMNKEKGIFKVDLESGETRLLLREADFAPKDENGYPRRGNVQLSHDGRSFIYSYQGPGKIFRVITRPADSNEETEICRLPIRDPSDNNALCLSPDGTRLAVLVREAENVRAIKVFPAASGEVREIHRFEQEDRWVIAMAWSPDSRYLYFSRQTDPKDTDEWQLWRVPSSGGKAQNLGLTANRFPFLCPHPDGKRIIFCSRSANETGGAAIWAMENFLPEEKPKDIQVRRVYQETGTGFVGSPSPDNRYFSDVDWGSGNLVVRDFSSAEQRLLTKNTGDWMEYALGSLFSADGEKLAYTWYNEAGKFEIRTIGIDGSNMRTLIGDLDVRNTAPIGWSADGHYVTTFNQTGAGTFEIVRVPARGGNFQILKTLEGILSAPWLSPDGRYLAYDRPRRENSQKLDVFVCPVEGGNEIPLAVHEANDTVLGWTPDGKAVLFASDRTGSNDAWIIPFDKGRPQGAPKLVRKDIGQVVPLGFAQNGSFYYGVQAGLSDVFAATLDVAAAKVLSPPVPVSKRLVGRNDSPAWSPDGKCLAYILRSTSWTKSLLCLQSTESGKERDLEPEMNFRWPLWSPDGRRILVWGRKDPNGIGFYVIDPLTGEVKPFVLDTPGYGIQQAAWSPDGKFIYFRRFSEDLKDGWFIRRDVQSGQETELLHNYPINESAVSPDSRRIVFRSYDQPDTTLKTMGTSGQGIREIVRVKNPEYIPGYSGLAWSPDGRYVLYFKARQTPQNAEKTELWRVDIETGECKPLGLTMERMRNLTLHPDGKRIAFDSGMPKVEIWVMENFLRDD